MIKKLLHLIRGTDKSEEIQAPQASKYSDVAEQCQDVVNCFKFSATLSPETPLKFIKRHGETTTNVDKAELSENSPFYVWVAELDDKYAFLSEGGSMSSAVGYLPRDGGDFVNYLISLRKIVERLPKEDETELDSVFSKATEIQAIKSGCGYELDEKCRIKKRESMNPRGDYLTLMSNGDNDWLIKFLIKEISKYSIKGLSIDHIRELKNKGFSSIHEILNAPDEVLLKLKGIGAKRVETVRQNLKTAQPEA